MENLNKSFEPMDVDLSAHSNSKMDISYNDSLEGTTQGHLTHNSTSDPFLKPTANDSSEVYIKKFRINMQNNVKSRNLTKVLTASIVLLLLSIIVFNILNINCSKEINLENLKNTLSSQVIGQSKAIDSIMEFFSESEKTKILFLYGGTGVGKTFTSSLLMENFGYSSNLYHYTLPSLIKSLTSDVMMGLVLCPNSLIIIDDCDIIDTNLSKEIDHIMIKSENLDKNLTIILIYNCECIGDDFVKRCNDGFEINLMEKFIDVEVMKKFIKFEPLTEMHLRTCIQKELGNKSISEQTYETILKNFDVTVDGCKGVHTKMKLLNIV